MRIDQIPPMGNAFVQFRSMRDQRIAGLKTFADEHGDIGRYPFVFGDVVMVNSPELVHDVLVTHANGFHKSPILRSALFPLAGEGLFTSEGELWKKQRKLMAPLFKQSVMGNFAEDMTSSAERAVSTWTDGAKLDVARETTRITMAIAGKTLFDTDTFDDADALGEALTTALEWAGVQTSKLTLIAQIRASIGLDLLADRAPAPVAALARAASRGLERPILVPGKRTRDLRAAIELLDERVAKMIQDRRATASSRRDLLSLLLSARDDDGRAMDDRQVRDEVLTLFVAGHETTASALAWALMLIAKHRDVYARVRQEVDAIGRVPSIDDLPRLGLSLRVFKESLRMYPPVYIFGRITTRTVRAGEYELPKGTVVLVSPYALHHKAAVWPDPDRFDPDRFTPEAEAKRHKSAFLPFSAGPRTCIGNHFALMEGPLVLATLLHYADFELLADTIQPAAYATLRPKGGIPMRVTLRAAAKTSSRSRAGDRNAPADRV